MSNWKEKRRKWADKLRIKYKLVILNDQTYEERVSFRLTRLNVFIAVSTLAVILIVLTILLIAFTPLREYIPGYTDVTLYNKIAKLQQKADSLEIDQKRKSLYLYNLSRILSGKDTVPELPEPEVGDSDYSSITLEQSREDSILRAEFEYESMYNLYFMGDENDHVSEASIRTINFFTPINGIVTNEFYPAMDHFGIDIAAKSNEAVKSTLDGVVIMADWTLETGYILAIQHANNLISVYKHNSSLLKQQGARVKAGEPIAIVGTSGELSTGPHLHFELWYNGIPVNPAELIIF
jgi:murein DD-endopeptidase MepM/ murein hydrolase activator NlpD